MFLAWHDPLLDMPLKMRANRERHDAIQFLKARHRERMAQPPRAIQASVEKEPVNFWFVEEVWSRDKQPWNSWKYNRKEQYRG